MSVCLDTSAALSQPANVPLTTNAKITEALSSEPKPEAPPPGKGIAKLVVTGQHGSVGNNQVLQKVVNSPLITVLNSAGPLTVVKSLCVTSVVSSAPHYTVVNSAPLTVTNAAGKPPTITVLNCGALNSPVTVVKAISAQSADKAAGVGEAVITPLSITAVQAATATAVVENRGHNVFVKNTCAEQVAHDGIPQSHKLLTASNFSTTNVLNTAPSTVNKPTTVNGQRNKVKILSNMHISGPSTQPNLLMSKTSSAGPPPRLGGGIPARPKLAGTNGASAKYFAKQITNIIKSRVGPVKAPLPDKPIRPMATAAHPVAQKGGPMKTITPNNFVQKQPPQPPGVKTISPQHKNVPGQMQRTGSGLRTIPPQRPQKPPTKPNYIGKHAVQAQKMKSASFAKLKTRSPVTGLGGTYHHQVQAHPEKQLTINQALAAQIIETLSSSSSNCSNVPLPPNRYEILPSRYDNAFKCPEKQQQGGGEATSTTQTDDQQSKSGLDALSLICQAVLLDHNYNATLPADSPPRIAPPAPAQLNGMSTGSACSPAQVRRRPQPAGSCLPTVAHNSLSLAAVSNSSSLLGSAGSADDDAASDISDCSDRKHDTEGEETDTAPEVEDVKNDDHYGDYVTRCICGFLHDDGYMVECDRCKVWQHVQCVVKNRQIPDEYLCEVCDPTKPVDRQKARLAQQQWMRERQLLEPKIRKETKLKDAFRQQREAAAAGASDSESSDGERPPRNNNVPAKGGRAGLAGVRKKAETARNARRDAKEAAVQRRPKRKERKIAKKKAKLHGRQQAAPPPSGTSHSDDENQDSWSAAHLPQLRQWIEKYEEAVTNHYSPELRARISSIRVNGAHVDSSVQYDSSVCRCRVHTQPLTEIKYLVSTVQLASDTPIIELRGKYMLSAQHRHSGGSLATRQHTQRPGPFLFFYKLHRDNTEVCVDTRTYGNSARFIRRSCRPNAELRHCIEKGVLHLYVVAIAHVEKNSELTIKHESHDLAAVGTTQIACACGRPEECSVNNKTTIKHNGDATAPAEAARKRRGRRTVSSCFALREPRSPTKEQVQLPTPDQQPAAVSLVPESVSPKTECDDIKHIEEKIADLEVAIDIKPEVKKEEAPIKIEIKTESDEEEPYKAACLLSPVKTEVKREKVKEDKARSPSATPISTRRSSHYKSDKEDGARDSGDGKEQSANKSKKLSREERKMEAILRAIEQMEKADQKKQEHQAKQAHRRESEPGPNGRDDDRQESKAKRRRRRGRARTTSTSAQARRSRLNSTDSYVTSGDENLLSPNDGLAPHRPPSLREEDTTASDKAADLLLALSNGGDAADKQTPSSPPRDGGSDSNTASLQSSPETPQLSSACLLVQAAVEPLESGFKFPKTKKGLMNEWLNKVPDASSSGTIIPCSLQASNDESASYVSNGKNLAALAQAASFYDNAPQQRGGNAKKRWLRQAISEDHSCDSPSNRPDSPPVSEAVAPPKKRRLPRESLSNDNSPPTTPTGAAPAKVTDTPRSSQEGGVEIVYSGAGDSPGQTMESDTELKERAAQMKQEFCKNFPKEPVLTRTPRTVLDPRLTRENSIFVSSNSEHLVGAVEKSLSILGFESGSAKPETITPTKRKLSITEYRQRKKLNTDKTDEPDVDQDSHIDNNSSESFRPDSVCRPRSGSSSSSTSFSSGDEVSTAELVVKAPAFNSEPTELERQREISSLRLKKAFGLATDDEGTRKAPVLKVNAILNCELETKLRASPQLTAVAAFGELSTSPMPRTADTPPDRTYSPAVQTPTVPLATSADETGDPNTESRPTQNDTISTEEGDRKEAKVAKKVIVHRCQEDSGEPDGDPDKSSNIFYTPDDDEDRGATSFEEPDVANYVPPFNNPVYPNNNFTSFTSSIDDDSRYQSRNPSPPPDLEAAPFSSSL